MRVSVCSTESCRWVAMLGPLVARGGHLLAPQVAPQAQCPRRRDDQHPDEHGDGREQGVPDGRDRLAAGHEHEDAGHGQPGAQRHPHPAVPTLAGAEPPRALGVVEVGPRDDRPDRDREEGYQHRADDPATQHRRQQHGTADHEQTADDEHDRPLAPLRGGGGAGRRERVGGDVTLGRQRPQEDVGRQAGATGQGEEHEGPAHAASRHPEVRGDRRTDAGGPATAAVAHQRRTRRPGRQARVEGTVGQRARRRGGGLVGRGHDSIMGHAKGPGPRSRGRVRGAQGRPSRRAPHRQEHAGAMTENPTQSVPPQSTSFLDDSFARLRNSGYQATDTRWFGGVCSGLAHRFGVDPVLIRAAAVVLAFLGGIGLTAYVLLWLVLPDQRGDILAERGVRQGDAGPIALLVLAAFLVLGGLFSIGNGNGWFAPLWLIPVAVVAWFVLSRRGGGSLQTGYGSPSAPAPYGAPPPPAPYGSTPQPAPYGATPPPAPQGATAPPPGEVMSAPTTMFSAPPMASAPTQPGGYRSPQPGTYGGPPATCRTAAGRPRRLPRAPSLRPCRPARVVAVPVRSWA